MKENEELKKNLADKIVVKIDAQALKSAESALAYKEKVIAEKNEVIADLTHELKAMKKKLDKKAAIENEQFFSDFINNAMNGFIVIKAK